MEDKISSTVKYLVEHDMKEIQQLLKVFEDTAGTYYEEELEKLRELVETWIEEEIQGKETDLNDIKAVLIQLERSRILKSNLTRFETVLNDIRENRHRITKAIRPMAFIFENSNNEEELIRHINHMVREKLINEEQREELLKEEELDLDKVIQQLKQVKVGRGLKFLPRLTNDLLNKKQELLTSLKNAKNPKQMKCNLIGVLDELLQRRGISKQTHKDLIEQHELDR